MLIVLIFAGIFCELRTAMNAKALFLSLGLSLLLFTSLANAAPRCERVLIDALGFAVNPSIQLGLVPLHDPVLRSSARPVTAAEISSPEFQKTIDAFQALAKKDGIGLAAPQVGLPVRMIDLQTTSSVIKTMLGMDLDRVLMINPVIEPVGDRYTGVIESCLSIPKAMGYVKRYHTVRVRYLDRHGVAQEKILKGMGAIVVQHEVDHLDGILFTEVTSIKVRKVKIPSLTGMESRTKVKFDELYRQLNPEQQSVFRKYQLKINHDLQMIHTSGSLQNEFLRQVGREADLIDDLLVYYRMRLDSKSSLDVEAISQWIKSDAHALFVIEDLYLSVDPKVRAHVAKLREKNERVRNLILTGIRGPPFENVVSVDVPMGYEKNNIQTGSLASSLAMTQMMRDWGLVFHKQTSTFQAQYRRDSTDVRIHVGSVSELLAVYRKYLEEKQIKSNERFLKHNSTMVGGLEQRPITFGLEAEYVPAETTKILEDYRLSLYPESQWTKLTIESRLKIAQYYIYVMGKAAKFKKLSTAPDWLPEKLDGENDKNFEFNGLIYSSTAELRDFMQKLEGRYGAGSYQGHVVFQRANSMRGLTGYAVLESDTQFIANLSRNYSLLRRNPDFQVAKSLLHHSLGPIGQKDIEIFKNQEESALAGDKVKMGRSGKTNAPIFRTRLYGKDKIGIEYRQYHKRGAQMIESMEKLTRHLENNAGLRSWSIFSNTPGLDPAWAYSRYEKITNESARSLKSVLSAVGWRQYFELNKEFLFASVGGRLAIAERFLFPLRDWENHPAFDKLDDDARSVALLKVRLATEQFAKDLSQVIEGNPKASEELNLKLRVLVSKWAAESGLEEVMTNAQAQLYNRNFDQNFEGMVSPFIHFETSVTSVAKLPELVQFDKTRFQDFPQFKVYRTKGLSMFHDPAYENFIQNSFEIIYDGGIHTSLRIGDRIYSFGAPKMTQIDFFRSFSRGSQRFGFVYHVPADRLQAIQKDIEINYAESAHYNLLAYSAFSDKFILTDRSTGGLAAGVGMTSAYNFIARRSADAFLVEDGPDIYLENPNGGRQQTAQGWRGTCVRGYSCSTSAAMLVNQYFGLNLDTTLSSKQLAGHLFNLPEGSRSADVVIDYSPRE